MDIREQVESKLDLIFVKTMPPLPANASKAIAEFLPFISAALGLLTLILAYGLYHAASTIDRLMDYSRTVGSAYGASTVSAGHVPLMVWLAVIVLVVEAVLFIAAFPAILARRKSGWELLLYAFLINIIYGAVSVFTNYSGIARLVGSLLGSIVGLYVLLQVRSRYSNS